MRPGRQSYRFSSQLGPGPFAPRTRPIAHRSVTGRATRQSRTRPRPSPTAWPPRSEPIPNTSVSLLPVLGCPALRLRRSRLIRGAHGPALPHSDRPHLDRRCPPGERQVARCRRRRRARCASAGRRRDCHAVRLGPLSARARARDPHRDWHDRHGAADRIGCPPGGARRDPLWALFAAAWVGAVSHMSLDLLSSARLRVFWPFADRQVSVPLVAMAYLWLAGILILGAAALGLSSGRLRPAVLHLPRSLAGPTLPCSARVARSPRSLPLRPDTRSRTAVGVVGIAVAFLAIEATLAARAVSAYSVQRGDTPTLARVVEARWASLTEWHIFDWTPEHLRYWRANGVTRHVQLVMTWPVARPGPLRRRVPGLPRCRTTSCASTISPSRRPSRAA